MPQKQEKKSRTNHIVRNISLQIESLKRKGVQVTIQWMPSHVGIQGNETADKIAVQATENSEIKDQEAQGSLTLGDAVILAKKTIWQKWTKKYISTTKGAKHFEFAKEPMNRPWCKGLQMTTEEKIVLSRIRSNHCMTKDRRFKWRWEDNELCDLCDEVEDLEHTLYHCIRWLNTRAKAKVLENRKPIARIFEDHKIDELKSIVQFLKDINVKL